MGLHLYSDFKYILEAASREHAKAHQVRRKSPDTSRRRGLDCVRQAQSNQSAGILHAEMVREAAAQELSEAETAPRLASPDRFALSEMRTRTPPADCAR